MSFKSSNKWPSTKFIVAVLTVAVMFALAIGMSGCGSVAPSSNDKVKDDSPVASSTNGGTGWSATTLGVAGDSYSTKESVADSDMGMVEPEPVASNGAQNGDDGWDLSGQKIVYTATMKLQTTEYDKATEGIKGLIEAHHGFISSENVRQVSSKSSAKILDITVRVPAAEYDAFVAEAGDVATVSSFSSEADNVTRQYSETQSLIESLEVQEKRLLELEAQAANVEDLLDIEDRLQSVRSNLTIQRNALSRLDTDVSYSTVMITLTDVSETGSTPSVREGLGERLGSGAVEAWDDFVEGLEDFLVDVVSVWPQLLITIAIVVLIIVLLVKRSKKVKAERERMMLDQSQAPQPQPQVGDKPEKAKKVANKELDRNVSDK